MMRRLSYMLGALSLLLACGKEGVQETPGIELTVFCNEPVQSKAGADGVQAGEDYYNENLISWVDIFFYPGGDTDSPATFHIYRESGKRYSDILRLNIETDIINRYIFPSEGDIRQATVFVVANYASLVPDEDDLSHTSLTELSEILVSTDFSQSPTHRQTCFVMSGSTTLTLRGRNQMVAATGVVELARNACKLTVGLNLSDKVTLGNEVWTPMPEDMRIYLVNGVKNVKLSGERADEPAYFSYVDNALEFGSWNNSTQTVDYFFDKVGDYLQTYPTYMYPQKWVYGSDLEGEREPYLKLVLSWKREADAELGIAATQKQFYYKIVMPDDRRGEGFRQQFIRNNWYHINLNVSILGAETDEAAVPMESLSCFVAYWQDKDMVIKQAEIGTARYLSVEKELYELHNVSEAVTIPYTSSHPAVIKAGSVRVTKPYYAQEVSNKTVGQTDFGGTIRLAGADDFYPEGTYYLEFDETQRKTINDSGLDWLAGDELEGQVIFQHSLHNDFNATDLSLYDYTPYTIEFTLVHADLEQQENTRYRKTVRIIQYPAIYMVDKLNSDVISDKNSGRGDHYGYVYVNGGQLLAYRSGTPSTDWWKEVWYNSGNRNLYQINTTVLPASSEFTIGDPRTDEVDNLDFAFAEAPSLDAESPRALKYYYPTEESERTRNMISPSYRISSKHGGVEHGGISYEDAKKRCAAFQEDGYPAGRWRIPTYGEVAYMARLSAKKAFPDLISVSASGYWTANGRIELKSSGSVDFVSSKSTALVRCVYDTWYWGDGQQAQRDQFVWGDEER